MLKIWGRKTSINVQKAMWAVGELGLLYRREDVGGPFGGLDRPEFVELTPHRLIPTLQDGEAVVWESNAIVRYLAARHGVGSLWPDDPAARARSDQWMDWLLTTLYPPFIAVFLGLVRTAPSRRDMNAIKGASLATGALMGILDRHLEDRAYIAADHLTMGDIPVGATLYRYFTLEIERPSLPNLEDYYARLEERAAYREHVMVPYDDMRVMDD
jgi:glutathione S-transferase